MRASTTMIRILVSSAGAALAVALVWGRIANSAPDEERGSQPLPGVGKTKSTESAESKTSDRKSLRNYLVPPVGGSRRSYSITGCFTPGIDITVPPDPGQSAIVAAALTGDWKTVRRMLNTGTQVEAADHSGVTLLMAAARGDNVPMIRLLLERHANPNFTDLAGHTALYYAISGGKLSATEALLPLVTNLEAACTTGNDPLTLAFQTGDMKVFQTVLEQLPATLPWTPGTRRALEAALEAGRNEQVRLLLSKHPAPPTREGGAAPLIAYAIVEDDAVLFHTLLACGSDPNIVIPRTAEKEFLSLLKSKHLRYYIQEETGMNLLMLAASLGKEEYVRALLDAGADRKRATSRHKMLPLYFAAWTENWKCVQMLLGGGPMPDQLRLEISLANQKMTVVKEGVTVFTTNCSTGREGFTTPVGNYVITDKDRDHRSTIYKVPMPYFMRLSCRDFGMHAGVVPTYPASHGCIRLPSEAARKLFAEIPVGTVVRIN